MGNLTNSASIHAGRNCLLDGLFKPPIRGAFETLHSIPLRQRECVRFVKVPLPGTLGEHILERTLRDLGFKSIVAQQHRLNLKYRGTDVNSFQRLSVPERFRLEPSAARRCYLPDL